MIKVMILAEFPLDFALKSSRVAVKSTFHLFMKAVSFIPLAPQTVEPRRVVIDKLTWLREILLDNRSKKDILGPTFTIL